MDQFKKRKKERKKEIEEKKSGILIAFVYY